MKLGSLVFFSLLASAVLLPGATYYISPLGDDNAAGNSATAAWRTLTYVNTRTFTAGDQLLFIPGGVVSGTLTAANLATGFYGSPASIKTALLTGTNRYGNRYLNQGTATSTSTWLSDAAPVSQYSSWGPVRRDSPVGGGSMTMNGVGYDKGLGVNANSAVIYNVKGCVSFTVNAGIDDNSGPAASVIFKVVVDGVVVATSPLKNRNQYSTALSADLTGHSLLALIADDNGNNADDHADWGYPQINCPVGSNPVPTGAVVLTTSDNIQNAINSHAGNTTFWLTNGTYRQQIAPKAGNRFIGQSQAGVIVDGADVISSFSRSGGSPNYWIATGQTQNLGDLGQPCDAAFPMCSLQDDFFIDNVNLIPVASLGAVTTGKYYFDQGAHNIYFLDDPASKTVEASKRSVGISAQVVSVTVDSLTVRHVGVAAQHGAIADQSGPGWVVRNVIAERNHGGGVEMGTTIRVLNTIMRYNGQIGIHGLGVDAIIDRNELAFNNALGYAPGFEAGGSKWARCTNLLVSNNYAHHNFGPGLWTDIDNYLITYDGNTVDSNYNFGITHEISFDAVIKNNIVTNNGLAVNSEPFFDGGISIDHSGWVEVYNNTVSNNGHGITMTQTERGTGNRNGVPTPYYSINNRVHDNVVTQRNGWYAGGFTSYTCGGCPTNDFDWIYTNGNNLWLNNTYFIYSSGVLSQNAVGYIFGFPGIARTAWRATNFNAGLNDISSVWP